MSLTAFTNTFAGNPLDRASDRRGDADWIAGLWADPAARVAALWDGKPLVVDGRIAWLPGDLAMSLATPEHRLFLGLDGEAGVFAIDLDDVTDPAAGPLAGRGAFEELRSLAASLPGAEAAILAAARATFEWRRKHQYCAVCGQPSLVADAGWKRVCPACKAQHFPRTDPVVIMLPVHGERCMLGRQAAWDPGRFSTLAGFLEPGESIEEACARELAEEAGLRTLSVRYHSSQPWPFPSSLMIGLIAQVADDEGAPDQTELVEVRWFTKDQARLLLAEGFDGATAPPPLAIAHQLIRAWVES